MMRVAIACDHVGFGLKAAIIEALEQDDHAVLDLGTHGPDPIDYPPMAKAVATAVGKGFVEMGILLAESGMGGAMAANRFTGIRAAACADPSAARESREQLDANFLCIATPNLGAQAAVSLVKEWVSAGFVGNEQALRMVGKIGELTGASATRGPAAARTAVRSAPAAPAASAPAPAPAPSVAAPIEAPSTPPVVEVPKAPDITAVMKVVAGVKEPDTKIIATRILQFLRNRFPTAAGSPTDEGFTFTLDGQHVASVTIGKNFVELEAGPDRITTSKIRDAERLDLLLNLPSITKAFDAIKV